MKWLHFAFVGGSFPRSPLHLNSARYLQNVQAPDVLNLNVGGVKYSLLHDDIRKFPSSVFNRFANESGVDNAYHSINRDGAAFKFVEGFLINGQVPRDSMGMHTLDENTLRSIESEAEYFNLDALARECRTECAIPKQNDETFELERERKYIAAVRECEPMVPLAYTPYPDTPLAAALREAWVPACSIGITVVNPRIERDENNNPIRTYTLSEFLEAIEERFNPEKSNHTLEIEYKRARDIVKRLLADSSHPRYFRLGGKLATRLRRVDIHKAGASYSNRASHDATIHNETHVGTLICTLVEDAEGTEVCNQTQFQGGQLQVQSGSNALHLSPEVMPFGWRNNRAFWATIDRNCTYSMSPVTSGARVSLVYDVYKARKNAPYGPRDAYYSFDPYGEDRHYYSLMRIVHDKEQRFYRELNHVLSKNDSVIIGLLHAYPGNCTTGEHLKLGDRVLHDALKDKYDVEIVGVTIHHDIRQHFTAGLHSEHIMDEVIAGQPKRQTGERQYRDTLVVPHCLTSSHILDQQDIMVGSNEYETDTLFLVSGLRIRRRGAESGR